MKQILLMIIMVMIATPALAVTSKPIMGANDASYIDPYKLPSYNNLKLNAPWDNKNKQSNRNTKLNKIPNTPALTIINEPYMPQNIAPQSDINFNEILSDNSKPKSLTIIDDKPTDITPAPLKADIIVPSEPIKITETWRARRGESLYQVLTRWSDRAGTKLNWTSMSAPRLPQDVSFVGSYEDAVAHALKISGANGVKPDWNNDTAQIVNVEPITSYTPEALEPLPLPLTPEPTEIAVVTQSQPMDLMPIANPESLPQRARFYALQKTSLEQALRSWAGSQEFELVWQADRDFSVKETVSTNDNYEMALRDILSMYDGDKVRPVGKLYRDRNSSKPVLVVKSEK